VPCGVEASEHDQIELLASPAVALALIVVSKRQAAIVATVHVVAGLLFLSPSYIRPDSVAVHSWLRSIVVTGDFLFFDEWAGFRMVGDGFAYFKEVTPIGALANHWWVGYSIVTAPFYLASHVLSVLLPGDLFPNDGFFGLDLAVSGWTAVLCLAVAVLCALLAIRRLEGVSTQAISPAWALAFACLGTPAFWYTFRMPIGTHATGMMVVGVLTLLCIRTADRDEPEAPPVAFLTGLIFGLAVATRIQHVVLLPAVLFAAITGRRSRRDWAAAATGALIPIAIQGVAWFAIYGTPFGPITAGANLEGATWMPFRRISFVPVLFSSWRGLFVWSPVWIAVLVGMALLARDRESSLHRRAGFICLLMFVGELVANSTLDRYWWGGMSFGPRRFVDLTVPVIIGLHMFHRRTRIAGIISAAIATGWSVLLMIGATAGTIDLSRYLDFASLARGAMAGPTSLAIGQLHSPVMTPPLLAQSIVAIALVAALTFLAWKAGAGVPARFARLVLGWTVVCLLAAIVAVVPTRERAAEERTRFGLDTEAAKSAGPLIDQRGLVSDELTWLESTGKDGEAAKVRDELDTIDARLRKLGIGP